MRVVILAAGMGSRLGLPDGGPKCLVKVNGAPYLSLQLDGMSAAGVTGGIIVGGYGIRALREFFASRDGAWRLVENPDFHLGNLYSLKAARSFIDGDFILFNADHYYPVATYRVFLSAPKAGVTAFCDHDRALGMDDMKVASMTDAHGVSRVGSIAKTLTRFDYGYVGVTHVARDATKNYWRAFAHVEKTVGTSASVEAVLAELAVRGENAAITDVSGSWWTEIDTPEDLARAQRVIAEGR